MRSSGGSGGGTASPARTCGEPDNSLRRMKSHCSAVGSPPVLSRSVLRSVGAHLFIQLVVHRIHGEQDGVRATDVASCTPYSKEHSK